MNGTTSGLEQRRPTSTIAVAFKLGLDAQPAAQSRIPFGRPSQLGHLPPLGMVGTVGAPNVTKGTGNDMLNGRQPMKQRRT